MGLVLAACAHPTPPRGAPLSTEPPSVLGTTPDSGAVSTMPRDVEFSFDKVVSERPQGVPNLQGLFLISPRDGEPRVSWGRNSISVRPRNGWRMNTTYTVTMLPGLTDLQSNVRQERTVTVFSTGPDLASSVVDGIVFDWVAGRPVPRAFVEAISLPDSVVYITTADSTGRYSFPNLPQGEFAIRGIVDVNTNRQLDPGELYHTAQITLADSAQVEILAFRHDSIPPRVSTITPRDSFTLRLMFDRPIDPTQPIDTSLFHIVAVADSAPVTVVVARSAMAWERETAERARAVADSLRRADTTIVRIDTVPPVVAPPVPPAAGPDTTPVVQAVVPSRPSPPTEIVLQVATPLQAGATYRLEVGEVRGLLGTATDHERTFTMPAAPPPTPPDTTTAADTTVIPPLVIPPIGGLTGSPVTSIHPARSRLPALGPEPIPIPMPLQGSPVTPATVIPGGRFR